MAECLGDARKAAGCEMCYVRSRGTRECVIRRRLTRLKIDSQLESAKFRLRNPDYHRNWYREKYWSNPVWREEERIRKDALYHQTRRKKLYD